MILSAAVNLESTESRVSQDTLLSLGSFAIPLLNSGLLTHVNVIHKSNVCVGVKPGDCTILEAQVSLQEQRDCVRIVQLNSSELHDGTASVWKMGASTVASISGVLTLNDLHVSMDQLEKDLHIWNSMHAFILGFQRIEEKIPQVYYCLDDKHRGFLPASVSRTPEEMYYYLEHAVTCSDSKGTCCSYGVSDVILEDSSSSAWGAVACLVSNSGVMDSTTTPQDTKVQMVSLLNSTHENVDSDMVQTLAKCAWSRKGGFTFRSTASDLPISIIRHGKTKKGSFYCSISRIVLYIFPMSADDSRSVGEKKNSMTMVIRSALNNAIQQLRVNLQTMQPLWVESAKPGMDAVAMLVDQLTKVLSRADDASTASKRFLLAMKEMQAQSMQDVQTKLREKVMDLRN